MGVCHGQPRTGVSITVDRGHVDRARFSNPESESTNPESENTPEGFSFLNSKMLTMEEIRLLKLDEHRLETIVTDCIVLFAFLHSYWIKNKRTKRRRDSNGTPSGELLLVFIGRNGTKQRRTSWPGSATATKHSLSFTVCIFLKHPTGLKTL
jgi:hypothetical protein